uniref:Uncharacterized protein n=1 Tax=Arundo donax TaxID=35708 RepID=A0A0A9FH55_ARUDO
MTAFLYPCPKNLQICHPKCWPFDYVCHQCPVSPVQERKQDRLQLVPHKLPVDLNLILGLDKYWAIRPLIKQVLDLTAHSTENANGIFSPHEIYQRLTLLSINPEF